MKSREKTTLAAGLSCAVEGEGRLYNSNAATIKPCSVIKSSLGDECLAFTEFLHSARDHKRLKTKALRFALIQYRCLRPSCTLAAPRLVIRFQNWRRAWWQAAR